MTIRGFLGMALLALVFGAPLAAAQQVPHPANGPASSTSGDLACWSGTTGSSLSDCGSSSNVVSGPATTTVGDVATWASTNGKSLADSVLGSLTVIPGGATVSETLAYIFRLRPYVTYYGAVCNGSTDDSAAFNTALSDNAGGTVYVPPARCLISGTVTIPANTTLECQGALPDSEDGSNIAAYATLPAILINSSYTITAGGPSASIKDCLEERSGMSFPVTNATTTYVGLANADAGYGSFSLVDDECVGFDSCFYGTGTRPYIAHDYFDCNGVTHACLDEENMNTDSGYFEDIKIQPIGSGNYGGSVTCAESERSGTGVRWKGINFAGALVSQNFLVADFEIDSPIVGGSLWADFPNACLSGNTPIGVLIKSGGDLSVHELNINSVNTGILDDSEGSFDQVGQIFFNLVSQDCLVIGQGATGGGRWQIGSITTNGGSSVNCGRYAINYDDDGGNGSIYVGSAVFGGVNGNAAPYIINTSTITPTLGLHVVIDDLFTNLAAGANPFSGFNAGSGAGVMLGSVAPSFACTGLGTGGSCTASVNSGLTAGEIKVTTGTSPATSGSVTINFPISAVDKWACSWVPTSGGLGGSSWPPETFVYANSSASEAGDSWSETALGASVFYTVQYQCRPI